MVGLVGCIAGRVQLSLIYGIKSLAGYLQQNKHTGLIEIVIENRGYAEKHLNFVRTDEKSHLWGGGLKMKPLSVEVIHIGLNHFKFLREAKEIYLTNGMRRKKKKKGKNDIDQFYEVKIIEEDEIKNMLMEYHEWARKNTDVYYGHY